MKCQNCELDQRRFFCENCLRAHLRDSRTTLSHISSERDEYVMKARGELADIEPARQRRATVSTVLSRIDKFKTHLRIMNEKNAETQERLASLRSSLSSRRQALSIATALLKTDSDRLNMAQAPSSNSAATTLQTPAATIARVRESHLSLQDSIARARSGLVQELVEVFGIFEVGGRPPLGGKAGTKGEWTIGGLVLPVPGDIRRYPPSQINAVLTHTIHFISLLTFYLGVKLPFEIVWSGGKLGVGQPSIYAGKGGEFGGWVRWTSKNPLHLPPSSVPLATATSAPISANNPTSPTSADPVRTRTTSTSGPQSSSPTPSQQQIDLASQSYAELPVSAQPPASFTTALSMLLYNVAYLAFTQSVDVPLSQTGEILRNLWAVCCSPDLGKRSHETHPLLAPPTPAQFQIDFAQLLQATTANPASRTRPRSSSKSSGTGGTRPSVGRSKSKKQEIIIEEEEWDLVEDRPEASFRVVR